mmetsp:Transcript_39962/g.100012  ORF Transcript_39962/g.100012 Transcript_39962/m.100012 type:complete len:80 (-) Transcript_39962:142-381(-)
MARHATRQSRAAKRPCTPQSEPQSCAASPHRSVSGRIVRDEPKGRPQARTHTKRSPQWHEQHDELVYEVTWLSLSLSNN